MPLALSAAFFILFVLIELLITPEPVLAPFLLRQKVPVLIGCQNFLVAICNFSVMYFFPMWFETVALTSASTAGERDRYLTRRVSVLIFFRCTSPTE